MIHCELYSNRTEKLNPELRDPGWGAETRATGPGGLDCADHHDHDERPGLYQVYERHAAGHCPGRQANTDHRAGRH